MKRYHLKKPLRQWGVRCRVKRDRDHPFYPSQPDFTGREWWLSNRFFTRSQAFDYSRRKSAAVLYRNHLCSVEYEVKRFPFSKNH